jgi:hypothetical protein
MVASVAIAAARSNLTSRDAVLRTLRTAAPAATDADGLMLVDDLIRQASDAIVTHCNRHFALQTYTESLPGYGSSRIMLSETPVVAVTSVLDFQNSPIVDYTLEDPLTGMLYRRLGWLWVTAIGWDRARYVIPRGEDPWYTVVYQAGYSTPETATPNLPGDIEKACIEIVVAWYLNAPNNPLIQTKRTRDTAITFSTPDGKTLSFPPNAIGLLEPWRRIV